MDKKVYISGMNSSQNPCSGLGIARCIRNAFPGIRLVGVDHSPHSSGLHDPLIDEVLLFPRWDQIDDELHVNRIKSILAAGNLWIPSIDMDAHWISENIGAHPNVLAPSGTMIERTAKPAVNGFQSLGFKVPEYISATLPASEIHSFLRRNAWQCWLKSPYHDAKRVTSWASFERAREQLASSWKTSSLFLQRNVVGNEESIAFCAVEGELLGAIQLEKYQVTSEGKTWAGRTTALDPKIFEKMRVLVANLGWSGGGEIEYLRDNDGQKWMIECNPRFPAWIYGGALAGINLPAKLISHKWDLPLVEVKSSYPVFTRVVQEVAAKQSIGIPLPQIAEPVIWAGDGKSGKGGSSFSSLLPNLKASKSPDVLLEDEDASVGFRGSLPEDLIKEIQDLSVSFDGETPARIFLESRAASRFKFLENKVAKTRNSRPRIQIAYSLKTSPTDKHLQLAKECGFIAESISQMEVHRAINFGFKASQVILNGPGKFWPLSSEPVTGLHMLFCDSIEEFNRVVAIPGMAECLGFRIKLPNIASRFGNALGEFQKFQGIVESIKKMDKKTKLGFHFHMPSWSIGVKRWMDALQSLLIWCQTIEETTGVQVRRLDLGGGFFPDDLQELDFAAIQEIVRSLLPAVNELYFEPGRALTQDTEILVSRVLDVRDSEKDEDREIVVDACIAELPLAQSFPHRIYYRPQKKNISDGECIHLRKGKARILGRVCMEDDILCRNIEIPQKTQIGDLLIFGDAGAYERTMSYGFGRG